MIIDIADIESYGAPLVLALVPSSFTTGEKGPTMISAIQRQLPTMPVMLVSIEENGPRAFAHFETHRLLALIQLERLTFRSLDLDAPLPEPELPF